MFNNLINGELTRSVTIGHQPHIIIMNYAASNRYIVGIDYSYSCTIMTFVTSRTLQLGQVSTIVSSLIQPT